MVHRHRRDHAGDRTLDHVGGVEPAAEADFEQQHVGGMAREQQEAGGGLDLEHGDRRVAVRLFAFLQRRRQVGVGHQHAAAGLPQAEALVEAHQIGRGVDVHAQAGGLQHRAQEGDGRALAVGAGDMDDRRQLALGMAERGEHAPHAVERQIDPLGMQREQPRQNGVDRRS